MEPEYTCGSHHAFTSLRDEHDTSASICKRRSPRPYRSADSGIEIGWSLSAQHPSGMSEAATASLSSFRPNVARVHPISTTSAMPCEIKTVTPASCLGAYEVRYDHRERCLLLVYTYSRLIIAGPVSFRGAFHYSEDSKDNSGIFTTSACCCVCCCRACSFYIVHAFCN